MKVLDLTDEHYLKKLNDLCDGTKQDLDAISTGNKHLQLAITS